MTHPSGRDDAGRGYRHGEDACLARTAEDLDFARTPDEARADAAASQVDPMRKLLRGLFRGILPRRSRR